MKKVFGKTKLFITVIIFLDCLIAYFLFTNRSFPRLAMWNIIEVKAAKDIYWHPNDAPRYFHFELESKDLEYFTREALRVIEDQEDDSVQAVSIAAFIKNISKQYQPFAKRIVWGSPMHLLKQLKRGARGINCFHYSIIYSTYLSSIGIKSRVWALEGNDSLEDMTHSVAEVYLQTFNKWVLIDSHWGIYFTDSNIPLSVLELREKLLNNEAEDIVVETTMPSLNVAKYALKRYKEFLLRVFLRCDNDFIAKYDSIARYGFFWRFSPFFDKLPSVYRRGLAYLLGRRNRLMHYVDDASGSLQMHILGAKAIFYFFLVSLVSVTIFLVFNLLKMLFKKRG